MIVTALEARRIESGRKVQHRYPRDRKPLEVGSRVAISYRTPNSAIGYDRDGSPRTETITVCWIRVTAIRAGTLADATEEDARAEGWRNLQAFRAGWSEERPERAVWIVNFDAIREERPRFLIPTSRIVAGRQGDYSEVSARALSHEPEAVDEDSLRQFTKEAREKEWDRERERRAARGELTFEEQVAAFAAEARRRHIDIRSELRAIRRWRDPRVCEKQLASIRRKLEPLRRAA